MIARFPGKKCSRCGHEIVVKGDEMELDPGVYGPRGGKQFMHSACTHLPKPGQAVSNPAHYFDFLSGNRRR